MFQQIPSIVGSSGNSSFYGYCNGKFNKNNWNLLNMPSVLIILATIVYFYSIYIYIYIITVDKVLALLENVKLRQSTKKVIEVERGCLSGLPFSI